MTEAAEIAGKLTSKDREALCWDFKGPIWHRRNYDFGLIAWETDPIIKHWRNVKYTPLGLAVAAHLKEQPQ